MKKTLALCALLVVIAVTAATALAAGPRVRVIHASPDAPAVDIVINDGQSVIPGLAFTDITDYVDLVAGMYNIKVVPSGATEPVVINADVTLQDDVDYSIVAVGQLANIEPLVLEDDNSAPASDEARVRFVHASPDAPAVDVAVKDGPVLFSNVSFKQAGDYASVDAGTYNLEVRVAGSENVALDVPDTRLNPGTVYTIYAMGLVNGEPALRAVTSIDMTPPGTMPDTGVELQPILPGNAPLIVLYVGLVVLAVGLTFVVSRRIR